MILIDSGREVLAITSDSCTPRWCNSSGYNISTLEEAGIKMATDVELGAVKAYTIGAEETAVKNRIMLSRLRQAADIASSRRLWNRKFFSQMN